MTSILDSVLHQYSQLVSQLKWVALIVYFKTKFISNKFQVNKFQPTCFFPFNKQTINTYLLQNWYTFFILQPFISFFLQLGTVVVNLNLQRRFFSWPMIQRSMAQILLLMNNKMQIWPDVGQEHEHVHVHLPKDARGLASVASARRVHINSKPLWLQKLLSLFSLKLHLSKQW